MKTVLVLGANGGIGKVVARAFLDKGWRVLGLVRTGKATGEGIIPIHADLFDAAAVAKATGPVDLVFNGLNVPYPVWAEKALPTYTAAADICEALNARQIYPGSVYNFGSSMPPVLTPQTPFAADTLKGRIRVSIEAPNSWMGALVAKDLGKGRIVTPGKKTTVHAWAFLPDLAATVVKLAEVERSLGVYEVFHFESHNVSAKRLAEAGRLALGRQVTVGHMPRLLFSAIALFDPFMRAALEMLYLWDVPHALEDARLAEVIGEVPRTPLSEAMKTLL